MPTGRVYALSLSVRNISALPQRLSLAVGGELATPGGAATEVAAAEVAATADAVAAEEAAADADADKAKAALPATRVRPATPVMPPALAALAGAPAAPLSDDSYPEEGELPRRTPDLARAAPPLLADVLFTAGPRGAIAPSMAARIDVELRAAFAIAIDHGAASAVDRITAEVEWWEAARCYPARRRAQARAGRRRRSARPPNPPPCCARCAHRAPGRSCTWRARALAARHRSDSHTGSRPGGGALTRCLRAARARPTP